MPLQGTDLPGSSVDNVMYVLLRVGQTNPTDSYCVAIEMQEEEAWNDMKECA